MENEKLSLLELPNETLQEDIGNKLDIITLSHLVCLNKTCYGLFQKPFLNARLERLAHYIVIEPNEDEIKKILNKYPELFLKKIKKVINHNGRSIINATLYQLAYGEGDVDMCEMLGSYFERACGNFEAGENERQKQIKERFADNNQAKGFDFKPIIQAISDEQFNHGKENNKWILSDSTLKAIETFRKDFDESQPKIIDKGMHFRLETLQELYETYAKAAAPQWEYHYEKCALLEDGIIPFVLRYVPENDAQKLKQGLYYLQTKEPDREHFNRAKKMRDGRDFRGRLMSASAHFPFLGFYVDIVFGM